MIDAIMALIIVSKVQVISRRSTYKLLKPSSADRPIFNFNTIWSLYIITAGTIIRPISVKVFVAP